MKFLVKLINKVNQIITKRKLPVFLWYKAIFVFEELFNVISCSLARETNDIQIAWMVGATVIQWLHMFKSSHIGVVGIPNHNLATTRARETDS